MGRHLGLVQQLSLAVIELAGKLQMHGPRGVRPGGRWMCGEEVCVVVVRWLAGGRRRRGGGRRRGRGRQALYGGAPCHLVQNNPAGSSESQPSCRRNGHRPTTRMRMRVGPPRRRLLRRSRPWRSRQHLYDYTLVRTSTLRRRCALLRRRVHEHGTLHRVLYTTNELIRIVGFTVPRRAQHEFPIKLVFLSCRSRIVSRD